MSESNTVYTDVAVLKTQVTQMKTVLTSIDNAIGKMTEIGNNTSKILAVHENKIEHHGETIFSIQKDSEEKISSIHQRMAEMKDENHKERQHFHSELMDAIKELDEKVDNNRDKLDKRVDALEKWKFWIMGGGAVFMVLVMNISKIVTLFG